MYVSLYSNDNMVVFHLFSSVRFTGSEKAFQIVRALILQVFSVFEFLNLEFLQS